MDLSVSPSTLPILTYPTAADVAALLRARTKDLTGNELGVFTPDTRPTNTEVEHLITLAYAEVTGMSGVYLAERCADLASTLIVIRAAMWVELSYFPEQVRSDRSVYRELAEQFSLGLPNLSACVEGNLPDAGGAGGTNAYFRFGTLDVHGWTASPYYGIPPDPPYPPHET